MIIQNSPAYGIATDYLSSTETNPNHDITIYGCTIRDCIYGRGINFWCENKDPLYHIYNILISHCTFDNVGREAWSTIDDIRKQECLTFRFLRDSVIEYNTITNLNVRVGMEIHGSENILIDHNYMDGTGLHSSCFLLYINSQASGAPGNDYSKNIIISNNVLTGPCQTLGLCSESGATSYLDGITIENNIITPTGGFDAIFMYHNDVANYFKNILIRHNTIYTSGSSSSCFYVGSGVTSAYITNIVVANNIFMVSSSGNSNLINAQGIASTNPDFLMYNNLFYKVGGGGTTNFLSGDGYMGTGYITSNPLLVSPGTDFHLQSGSPAINAGSTTYTTTYDFDGYLRDSQPDIGAYEYHTSKPPAEYTNHRWPCKWKSRSII